MHSSYLRGTDFEIIYKGKLIPHATFFDRFSNRERVGLIAPNGTDGVGAVSLIMAYVTAFYDTYRVKSNDFFAYPAFFTFQHVQPLASYTMLDIWPKHKDVYVEPNPVDLLHAINDRAINVLIIPEGEPTEPGYEEPQIESALRTIDRAFLYSLDGEGDGAGDLSVTVYSEKVVAWAGTIFDDHDYSPIPAFGAQKAAWLSQFSGQTHLTQSFSEISVEEALTRL